MKEGGVYIYFLNVLNTCKSGEITFDLTISFSTYEIPKNIVW